MATIKNKLARVAEHTSADVTELLDHVRPGHRQGHYYLALLGLRKYDPLHAVDQIQRGFSYSALERFQRNTELSLRILAQIVEIPERTLARRKATGRLAPDESDRLARFSRVFARAIELFEGDPDAAREWLTRPVHALGGKEPLELTSTDAGAIEVERLIGRLEHGIPS
ncbi:MAG: antitoxin Xre/MbcA/ParS toxin-binding domain-containing protein [Gemmatimonadaceae bacterium]